MNRFEQEELKKYREVREGFSSEQVQALDEQETLNVKVEVKSLTVVNLIGSLKW